MKTIQTLARAGGTLLTVLATALLAQAQAAINDNLGVSNKAVSVGNAVTADPPGIMSIHFNPAGLARLGTQAELNIVSPLFKWEAEFIAPPDHAGVFGYEDPVAGGSSSSRSFMMYAPVVGWIKTPQPIALPLPAFSFRPEDSRFTFATGAYAPSALGFHRDDPNDPARFGGQRLALQRLTYFAPSFGYRHSESLSFGASIGFNYTAFALRTKFRAPNELIGFVGFMQDEVCEAIVDFSGLLPECLGEGMNPYTDVAQLEFKLDDPLALSYNLGVLWEPSERFALGATYQSRVEANMSGDFEFRNGENLQSTFNAIGASPLFGPIAQALGLPTAAGPVDSGRARLTMIFPARVQIGMKLRPLQRLQLNVDWNWSEWSEWETLDIGLDRQTPLLQFASFLGFGSNTELVLPRGYESVPHWSFGLMYDLTERVQLRFGYEPRKSSIPAHAIDTIAPLGDAELYGVGIGYTWNRHLSLDLAAAYLSSETYTRAGDSCNMNCSGIGNLVYNPYAGLDVKTGLEVIILGATATLKF